MNRQSGTEFIEKVYNRPLVDLGYSGNPQLLGIYSPGYGEGEVIKFMSSRYADPDKVREQTMEIDLTSLYHDLILEALNVVQFPREDHLSPTILDVGCGFGNTTLPLLEIFPQSRIVATELSLPMLMALKDSLYQKNKAEACTLLQLNAEELDFKEDTFDLIVGAAILHHLFHPGKVFASFAKILKPGGHAIFFEPFENGYSILNIIYRDTLKDAREEQLTSEMKDYLKNTIDIWNRMKGNDKSDSFFFSADDKWLFTKEYIHKISKENGFGLPIIYPITKVDRPFYQLAETHIKGNKIKDVPDWFWNKIDEYEQMFSYDLKRDLLTEGCIIVTKAG